MDEAMNCPNCGSDKTSFHPHDNSTLEAALSDGWGSMFCDVCMLSTGRYPNRAEARAAWQMLHARADERRKVLDEVRCELIDLPEINPSNYDHETVCQLNAGVVDLFMSITRQLEALDKLEAGNE